MVAAMRQSFILPLLLGSVLAFAGSFGCGGNVVVDGTQGSGAGGAGGTAAISTTTATGGFGGAIPPGATSGTGIGPACTTCAEHLVDFEMGLPSALELCTAAATTAVGNLTNCACAGPCGTACVGNACIGEPASGPCIACIDADCANEIATCESN